MRECAPLNGPPLLRREGATGLRLDGLTACLLKFTEFSPSDRSVSLWGACFEGRNSSFKPEDVGTSIPVGLAIVTHSAFGCRYGVLDHIKKRTGTRRSFRWFRELAGFRGRSPC